MHLKVSGQTDTVSTSNSVKEKFLSSILENIQPVLMAFLWGGQL